MKQWLKELFCFHEYGEYHETYYEGFPPESHGYYICKKCGKKDRV